MALLLLWSSRLWRCLRTSPILAVLFSSYPGLVATSSLAHTQKAGVGRDLLTRYMRLCVRSGSTLHTYKMTEWGECIERLVTHLLLLTPKSEVWHRLGSCSLPSSSKDPSYPACFKLHNLRHVD